MLRLVSQGKRDMKKRTRTRSVGLIVAAFMLIPLPAAFAEHEPLDEPVISAPQPSDPALEAVVYNMIFPIQGGATYTNNFGDCRGGPGCPRTHEGIDILQPKMTPVLAVASGTVGWMHNTQGGNCCAFELNHDDGWESWYIHLNNDTPGTDDGQGWGFAPGVEPGASITAGQLIGWVGDSGNAEGAPPHLHFELHRPGGAVTNPYDSLNAATVLQAPLGTGNPRGCDFDNDGYDDLAIGTPGEDISSNTKVDAGAVTVLYGTSSGLTATGVQYFTQSTAGVDSGAKDNEEFGYATACGDVNNDGFDDLVVGVPGEAIGGDADAGAVNLIFGSQNGLAASGSNFWHQDRSGVGSQAEVGDRFGESLAVGDFDNDGFADVAVGVPGEKIVGQADAGMVTVLYGSSAGFDGTSLALHENATGISGSSEAGDSFGTGLAAGDFDNDNFDDLAIGIHGEDSSVTDDSGAIVVVYGTGSGLSTANEQRFTQNFSGIEGDREDGEMFGFALTSGDFDGDNNMDLAIGVPGDRVGSTVAGGVNVMYGSGSGLTASGDQLFQQGVGGVLGNSDAGDLFGYAVTFGDFDGDGNHDIGIGIPGEQVSGAAQAGSVAVIYGSASGLTAEGDDVWSQDTFGIKGAAQTNDMFGQRLASGDFAASGVSDLVVGVPLEDIGADTDAGSAQVIVGRPGGGLDDVGDQHWDQNDPGVPGGAEPGDNFGHIAAAVA